MSAPAPAAGSASDRATSLVRRTDVLLRPDPRRVVARLFLPGQETSAPGLSRAAGVVARCLAMSEQEARSTLDQVLAGHRSRHRNFEDLLDQHYRAVAHWVEAAGALSLQRRRLIGSYFTQEYALEAAALFNPSLVAHPRQDTGAGRLRLLMSARAVGEGHLSSIVFRTGVLSADPAGPTVTMDPAAPHVTAGELQELTVSGSYLVQFPADTHVSERALLPVFGAESHGMEDARFVHFLDEEDDGATYLATYTAYDGSQVTSRRLETDDFRTFMATSFTGVAATNKGMALFPRRINGRYAALSRWDRQNNAISFSDDGHHWPEAAELQTPQAPWELIQLGNCGPPLETPAGWLVLTHGVGPVREYSIGALLLDRDDPTRIIGRLPEPLLTPTDDERDGYVPNVVYSCGALVHDQTVLFPYGCSDSSIRLALLDLPALLDWLLERP